MQIIYFNELNILDGGSIKLMPLTQPHCRDLFVSCELPSRVEAVIGLPSSLAGWVGTF